MSFSLGGSTGSHMLSFSLGGSTGSNMKSFSLGGNTGSHMRSFSLGGSTGSHMVSFSLGGSTGSRMVSFSLGSRTESQDELQSNCNYVRCESHQHPPISPLVHLSRTLYLDCKSQGLHGRKTPNYLLTRPACGNSCV